MTGGEIAAIGGGLTTEIPVSMVNLKPHLTQAFDELNWADSAMHGVGLNWIVMVFGLY